MKILLTTIVDNTNIGTYLQALATVRSLEKIGHTVTVLNYYRKYITGPEYAWRRWKGKLLPLRFLYTIAYVCIVNKNIKRVRRFLLERVSLTPKVDSLKKVVKYSKGYDLYLTGSDQVWNCGHNYCFDPVFCNGFTSGYKASYAASIGMEHFPQDYIQDFKNYLTKYKYLSVRESSAVSALAEIGINNVKEVLDPTLLLNKKEWSKIINLQSNNTDKYLLVYSVEDDKADSVYSLACLIAKKLGLKMYYLTTGRCSNKKHSYDKVIQNALPEDFLLAFLNASFTVVSSFHGTAFSLNFNIPFYTVLPNKYNTRVVSLLKRYELAGRMTSGIVEKLECEVDFSKANEILENDRIDSVNYLKEITQ